jgi:hypothetical protein
VRSNSLHLGCDPLGSLRIDSGLRRLVNGQMAGKFACCTRLRYPDFICVGAQKAGTSWLHRMLSQAEGIWMPPAKELHYFDVLYLSERESTDSGFTKLDQNRMEHALRQAEWVLKGKTSALEKVRTINTLGQIGLRELTDEWYGLIFRFAEQDIRCGEITPEYALLPERGIHHMLQLNADLKCLFILRDPIDRGWSDLRMMRGRAGGENFDDLKAVNNNQTFFAKADYMATVDRFRRMLGPENFLLLFYDDIVSQPEMVLRQVFDFVGVTWSDAATRGARRIVHQGQPIALETKIYEALRDRLRPVYEKLLALQHPAVDGWYRKHYV